MLAQPYAQSKAEWGGGGLTGAQAGSTDEHCQGIVGPTSTSRTHPRKKGVGKETQRHGGAREWDMEALDYFGPPYIGLCQWQELHLSLTVASAFYRDANQIFCWVDEKQSVRELP